MNNLNNNFLIGKLKKTLFKGLYATLYIGFDDDVEFLKSSFLNLGVKIIKLHLSLCLFNKVFLVLLKVCVRILLGLFVSLMSKEYLSGIWNIRKTKDLNRL